MYAVMRLKWKPSEFAFLPDRERAAMYAFIDHTVQQEAKERKRIESKSKK